MQLSSQIQSHTYTSDSCPLIVTPSISQLVLLLMHTMLVTLTSSMLYYSFSSLLYSTLLQSIAPLSATSHCIVLLNLIAPLSSYYKIITSPLYLTNSSYIAIEQILDPSASHTDRVYGIVRALDLCVGSVADAVGRVGDVAQCMGLGGFRSAEGTIERCYNVAIIVCVMHPLVLYVCTVLVSVFLFVFALSLSIHPRLLSTIASTLTSLQRITIIATIPITITIIIIITITAITAD
jgi:hypothetical protein